MKWIKNGKIVSPIGTTIIYQAEGMPIQIESRKRHIPHANGIGTWDHTSYFVFVEGRQVAEKMTLRDAKAYAEEVAK